MLKRTRYEFSEGYGVRRVKGRHQAKVVQQPVNLASIVSRS